MIKKVIAIGPESTGKSTLCTQLAAHYKTSWVPEFARRYLEENDGSYNYEDLLVIAKNQVALEQKFETMSESALTVDNTHSSFNNKQSPSNTLLFIDTDMYVMKVWCEYVFNRCHNWILNQIVKQNYDLYLLCNVDLPWTKDNLREYPDLKIRNKLYRYYKDIMINQATPWIDISGTYDQRLKKAIESINSTIS